MWECSKDKTTEMFTLHDDMTTESVGVKDNPCYVNAKRPKWCRKKKDLTPSYRCKDDECPFLALSEIECEEEMIMVGAWADSIEHGDEIPKEHKP